MKVVLIQQYSSPNFGVLALMSYLRHHKIDCDVVIWSLEKSPVETLRGLLPDLIGVSLMTTEHYWMVDAVRDIRTNIPDVKIIIGGIHAIIYPDEILSVGGVDFVCNSDGEKVLLELCSALAEGRTDWSTIKGLVCRDSNGVISSSGRANFVEYSPEIIEDRTPYFSRYPLMARDTVPRFIASRGCPYDCSFCYNGQIKNIFKGSYGKYLRYKDPDNLIREISTLCRGRQVDSIFFVDDLFSANKKWLSQFLGIYKKEIGYPFMCTTRANLMDDDLARMLSEAGCQTISYGIETGNASLRGKILNKKISDEQMVQCGQIARKYGMQVQTANMFCLPDETLEDSFKTIELNHRAGTNLAFSSLFLPFPDTALANYCIEKKYLKPDFSFRDLPTSFLTESMLSLENKESIINVQKLSYLFIRYPWIYRRFRGVVQIQALKPVFSLLYMLSNFLRHKAERKRSFFSAFLYAWQFRKTL